MIVHQATKSQFLSHCDNGDIEDVILQSFKTATGKMVAAAEMKAWKSSLTEMAKVLRAPELPSEIGVAIELHIPQTSKRLL